MSTNLVAQPLPSKHDNMPIYISRYESHSSKRPKIAKMSTWAEARTLLMKRDVRSSKNGECITYHRLSPGSTRSTEGVEDIFAYVIDCDSGSALTELTASLNGVEYVVHTTHSHTPDQPKFRLVAPIARPVIRADWIAFRTGADELYAASLNDPATADPARLYYAPSCPENMDVHAFYQYVPGTPIDPDPVILRGQEILSRRANLGQLSAQPGKSISHKPISDDELTAHTLPATPFDADLIAKKCQQVKLVKETGGKDYEQWRRVIGILKFCTDGEALSHSWSSQAQEYSHYETQQKFNTWSTAPSTCEALMASNPTGCEGCPSKGRIKTPLVLGRIQTLTGGNASEGSTHIVNILESLNDAGNADRLARAAAGNLRYCAELKSWLAWKEGHWHKDERGEVIQFATTVMRHIFEEAKQAIRPDDAKRLGQHASNSLSLARIEAAIELTKSCPGIAVSLHELDSNPYLIGVTNGVVDLRTGQFRKATPEDLVTRRMNVSYEAGATCPTWQITMHSVLCGSQNVVDFYQRAVGYSMTGDTTEQCFFFLHGSGANGKSTVLNTHREIMGEYAIQTSPEVLMAKTAVNASGPTPEVARLAGPRFVAANETEEGQRLGESMVKQLTGGDAITARVLHGSPFDFVPKFKLWVAGNHRPVIRGGG